jgi:DNA-binding beta-propeller fold protein YncE
MTRDNVLFRSVPGRFRSVVLLMAGAALLAPAATPNIQAKNWTKPKTGWLYVLDPKKGGGDSEILLVDPEQTRVMGSIRADYLPDMALSPDGKRLYVLSGAPATLSVIDTASGALIAAVEAGDRIQYLVLPDVPALTVSPDGRWVYVLRMHSVAPLLDVFAIATFDTAQNRMLPEEASVPNCGAGHLIPGREERSVLLFCVNSNDMRLVTLSPNGGIAAESDAVIPEIAGVPGGAGNELFTLTKVVSPTPDATSVRLLTASGGTSEVAVAGSQLREAARPAFPESSASKHLTGRWIPLRPWPRSPDGSRIYVGSGRLENRSSGLVDAIHVVDAGSGRIDRTIQTTEPFWSIATSADKRHLYTISPATRSISVIDLSTGERTASIRNMGETPVLAVPAP